MCMLKCVCARVCVTTTETRHLTAGSSPPLAGAGVGPTIQIGEQTVITVDAKAAGKGKVTCSVCTPEGAELDVDVVENEDGTFDIFYMAPQPGEYVICVRFGGEHIPNSPFQVTVSRLRASQVFESRSSSHRQPQDTSQSLSMQFSILRFPIIGFDEDQ